METNENGPLVLRDVQHLLLLEMLNPTLVFGVVVPLTPIVGTAQHQMIFVMVVENAATGNKCAGASSARMVSSVVQDSHSDPQPPTYHITHDVYQVSSAPKGIFVDLDLSPPVLSSCPQRLRFQVDSGCSCNTIHVTDLNKLSPVQVDPSPVRLLDYSKAVIPTSGKTTLQCTHRGETYELVVQIITAQRYYAPLLGLADSTRMGIIHYDVDNANHLESTPPSPPPLGELSLDFIKCTYPELFEGLGKLGKPLSITLKPEV